jgi:hypothetical protein
MEKWRALIEKVTEMRRMRGMLEVQTEQLPALSDPARANERYWLMTSLATMTMAVMPPQMH